jgi:hypothetical protein
MSEFAIWCGLTSVLMAVTALAYRAYSRKKRNEISSS